MPPRFLRSSPNRLLTAALMALWVAPGFADTSTVAERSSGGGFFVAAVASLPEYEGADGDRLVPFVVGRFQVAGSSLELEGLTARFDVLRSSRWRGGPVISFTLPRDDSFVDQPVVQLLEEVDPAVELGLFAGFELPLGRSVEDRLRGDMTVRRDVVDAHDGLILTAEVDYFFKISRMQRLGLAASVTWADGPYHRTYFSMTPENAVRSGLPVYEAGSGLKDVGVEVYGITSFSETWGVFTRVAYHRLQGDAADSPLVVDLGSRDQTFLGAGVFYRW